MTPHRTFVDDEQRLWNAWDVIPAWGERRVAERRHRSENPPAVTGERRAEQRRRRAGIRIALPPHLVNGWIAYECGDERRRTAPIPEGWDSMDEEALRSLWRGAERLGPRRKRLIE